MTFVNVLSSRNERPPFDLLGVNLYFVDILISIIEDVQQGGRPDELVVMSTAIVEIPALDVVQNVPTTPSIDDVLAPSGSALISLLREKLGCVITFRGTCLVTATRLSHLGCSPFADLEDALGEKDRQV